MVVVAVVVVAVVVVVDVGAGAALLVQAVARVAVAQPQRHLEDALLQTGAIARDLDVRRQRMDTARLVVELEQGGLQLEAGALQVGEHGADLRWGSGMIIVYAFENKILCNENEVLRIIAMIGFY